MFLHVFLVNLTSVFGANKKTKATDLKIRLKIAEICRNSSGICLKFAEKFISKCLRDFAEKFISKWLKFAEKFISKCLKFAEICRISTQNALNLPNFDSKCPKSAPQIP
jgi:hypothetical protein